MDMRMIDRVVEREDGRLVAERTILEGEDFLRDHFPTFPVLPGVLMLEAMVQAARELAGESGATPLVLGRVRALKYGRFIRPGETMRIEVSGGEGLEFRGRVEVASGSGTAVAASGRITLRPAQAGAPVGGAGVSG